MAQKGKIIHRLIEKTTEAYPDDPEYKESKNKYINQKNII